MSRELDTLSEAAAREALLERRADRVRKLAAAIEVIALGYDDAEDIRVWFDPSRYAGLPGVRTARR